MCQKSEKPSITLPVTPNLVSRKRARPNAKSHAEIEEEEAEQMKKYTEFK